MHHQGNSLEQLSGVFVSSCHHVCKTSVVEKVEVCGNRLGEYKKGLEVDSLNGLNSCFVVADEDVDSELTDKGEETEVLRSRSRFFDVQNTLLEDLRLLNHSFESLHNSLEVPESEITGILCEDLLQAFVVLLDGTTPSAGVVELVDVLINDIPDPGNGKRELDLCVDNGVEE